MIRATMVTALVGVVGACNSCGASTPQPTVAELTTYAADQDRCVLENPDRPSIDACRAKVRAALCARYPSLEVCAVDGGAGEGGR